MATVLHCMQRWLPLSEQFVYTLLRHSRHRGVVLSRLPIENQKVFPHRPVLSLGRLPEDWPRKAWHRRLITAGILATARRYRARLIHQHHGYRIGDLEGPASRLGLPFVVSLHGHDVTAHAQAHPDALRRMLPRADAVIVPSQYTVAAALELGARADAVHVIPSGVDLHWFSPSTLPDGPLEALFVGRFVEKKGLDVLLNAWTVVETVLPGARLRLLGHGPLESLARSGGDRITVETTDPARRAEQVRDAIRRARVVVTPSRTAADGDVETLLLVNLEAQASGRPVVTTRHGGIPEFVREGRTALLVPENDSAALADALVSVLRDERMAEAMGAEGPVWARRFDVRECVARVDALYEGLMT